MELKNILGLALLGRGDRRAGLRNCEESLAAATKLDDVRALLGSRLAVLQALVEIGDRAGAFRVYHDLEPALNGHPESRWRAFALMARIDRKQVVTARKALAELTRWGDSAYRTYLNRPDVQRLPRPLLKPISAKQ